MLHPSYYELMDKINEESNTEEPIVTSRYSLVIAASKRARQLVDDAEPKIANAYEKNLLTVAVEELYQGKVTILPEGEEAEEDQTSQDLALTEESLESEEAVIE